MILFNCQIQRPHSVLNLVSSDLGDQIKTVTVKLRKADKTLGINICEGRVSVETKLIHEMMKSFKSYPIHTLYANVILMK